MITALTATEWAQLAGTAFTAIAASAALLTVIRAEKDRWDRRLPDFQVEPLRDFVADQTRLTIINHGGPARDVRIAGVEGKFGYFGVVPPTANGGLVKVGQSFSRCPRGRPPAWKRIRSSLLAT